MSPIYEGKRKPDENSPESGTLYLGHSIPCSGGQQQGKYFWGVGGWVVGCRFEGWGSFLVLFFFVLGHPRTSRGGKAVVSESGKISRRRAEARRRETTRGWPPAQTPAGAHLSPTLGGGTPAPSAGAPPPSPSGGPGNWPAPGDRGRFGWTPSLTGVPAVNFPPDRASSRGMPSSFGINVLEQQTVSRVCTFR